MPRVKFSLLLILKLVTLYAPNRLVEEAGLVPLPSSSCALILCDKIVLLLSVKMVFLLVLYRPKADNNVCGLINTSETRFK